MCLTIGPIGVASRLCLRFFVRPAAEAPVHPFGRRHLFCFAALSSRVRWLKCRRIGVYKSLIMTEL